MGTTEDIFTGIAGRLNAASIGTYITTGAYATTDTAIVRGGLPSAPDRAIAIRTMRTVADVSSPFSTFLIAVICRGMPNDQADAANLADAITGNLVGLTHTPFGATNVVQIRFGGQIDLDEDDLNRTRWSVKLLADVDETPTNLRPEGGWD